MRKLTQEEFIEKAIKIFGNKYDYSQSIYINSRTKIKINCLIHGEFYILSNDHLQGNGCNKCGNKNKGYLKKDTQISFIQKLKIIYKDEYIYSEIKYVDSKNKIKIICIKHGIWEATPNSLLCNHGCPNCAIEKRSKSQQISQNEFLLRSKGIHNNLYDYSLVNYNGRRSKIKIICNICKSNFYQVAETHLNGSGCPFCGRKFKIKYKNIYRKS